MKKLLSLTALSLLLLTSVNAFAFPHFGNGNNGHHYGQWKHMNGRQFQQCNRLQHGIQNGQLTRFEARQLGIQGRRIAQAERRYRADGYLSSQERNRLKNLQNQYSRNLYRQSHDGQRTLP